VDAAYASGETAGYASGAASVTPEDGIGQSDVDAAYADGAASVTPEDGIGQSDVDAAYASGETAGYASGAASVTPEDGIGPSDVNAAYADGAASVTPEDGIGPSDVDAAYVNGAASVTPEDGIGPSDVTAAYDDGYDYGYFLGFDEGQLDGITSVDTDAFYDEGYEAAEDDYVDCFATGFCDEATAADPYGSTFVPKQNGGVKTVDCTPWLGPFTYTEPNYNLYYLGEEAWYSIDTENQAYLKQYRDDLCDCVGGPCTESPSVYDAPPEQCIDLSECDPPNPSWIGDGFCDNGFGPLGPYNVAECAWDGGDCCESTCDASLGYCYAFECLDPLAW
jgi:hypothetical protein